MKHLILLALTTLGSCCGNHSEGGNNILPPQEYDNAIKADPSAVIIDVRKSSEYQTGHIEGASSLDVLDTATFNEGLKSLDKEKTYYIYCRSGGRSHDAACKMQSQGLKVVELKGGIMAWERAGMKLAK